MFFSQENTKQKARAFLAQKIEKIKGISQQRAKLFQKLGLETYEDFLYHVPYRYEMPDEKEGTYILSLAAPFVQRGFGRKTYLKAKCYDHAKKEFLYVTFFNSSYVRNRFLPSRYYLCHGGKESVQYGEKTLVQPKFRLLNQEEWEKFQEERQSFFDYPFQAIYASTEGLQAFVFSMVSKHIFETLEMALQRKDFTEEDLEIFPAAFRKQHKFTRLEAWGLLHFPKEYASKMLEQGRLSAETVLSKEKLLQLVQEARQFFATEEARLFLIALHFLKQKKKAPALYSFTFQEKNRQSLVQFVKSLPFSLTEGQKKAWQDIFLDLQSPYAMHRLLQGDVGSGKTVLAALAALAAMTQGKQVLYMAPTSVLATQVCKTLQSFYQNASLPYKVELLLGDLAVKKIKQIREDFSSKKLDMLVGTTALLNEAVDKENVALVISDEQHRFGVKQRQKLQKEDARMHVLSMSATPIPRTLGLILYGDMALSELKEKPLGRPEVKTFKVSKSRLPQVFQMMKEELDKGSQVYVICPLKEEKKDEVSRKEEPLFSWEEQQETSELYDVHTMKKLLEDQEVLKGKNISVLHGEMKNKEKEEILLAFQQGHLDILVSTTVVEVGVHNENANFMLIMNAESFGLSQLHQLRGRIGRTEKKEEDQRRFFCLLYTDQKGEKVSERMRAMCQSSDGFFLAEEDLRLRGPGNFFGLSQHGMPRLKFANLMEIALELKVLKKEIEELFLIYGEKTLFEFYDQKLLQCFGDFYEQMIL